MQNTEGSNKNMLRSILRLAIATAFILLIPFLGGWPWTLSDFIIVGILIFGTGLAYELVTRNIRTTKHRVVIGLAFLAALAIVWIDLAVGLFNIPGISGS